MTSSTINMNKFPSLIIALFAMLFFSQFSYAKTVTVVNNSTSGIKNATFTATLEDGTVLGFYNLYSSYCNFVGAISDQSEICLPDSVIYESRQYSVSYIGSQNRECDFTAASSVKSLYLPPVVWTIYALGENIKEVHLTNYVNSFSDNCLANLDRILVPKEHLDSYYGNTSWLNAVLINEEGTQPKKVTINMTKVGEFAQLLLQQTDNWYEVNELTVVGDLNTDDLNVFKRMKQLTKLDLSMAKITNIPNNFDGGSDYSYRKDGFSILETLILPEIETIGSYAFSNCHKLKNVTIPKVGSIGNGAFAQAGFSEITIPEGITSIDGYVFYCSNLERFNIPSTVTKIGGSSFRGTNLATIDLSNIKEVESDAFAYCAKLEKITFSQGLKSLGSCAFNGCTSLNEIDLPSSLNTIIYNAFSGCSALKKVVCRAIVPPTTNGGSSILGSCDMTDVKLYVPAMSIDQYRAETGWKTFYTILPMDEKVKDAYIYDFVTIDDASQFTTDCNFTLDWLYQTRGGSSDYYCGVADYEGNSTLSMHDYKQNHYMGSSSYSNNSQYSYNAHHTSLISNGTMRADNVQTTIRIPSTSIWYFISLPYDVKISDISYTEGTQFVIRKYSGHNRASQSGETWVDLTANDIMQAYEGYILKCNKEDADFTFPAVNNANKNKIFENKSIVLPLEEYLSEFEHNRSWNLIGNPYPCFYDTRFMNFTAPLTVWNRQYQRYDAYSPIDDSYILHPSQSFFVQRPVDQSEIIFDKEGRQSTSEVQIIQRNAAKRASSKVKRSIYNVTLSNGLVNDHTRFVINETASIDYELDKDASKFITDDNSSILVYTIENNVKYAINERPLVDEIVNIGFFAPSEGNYTLSLENFGIEDVILIDKETNTEHLMSDDYNFNASTGYNNNRFAIKVGGVTSIESINSDSNQDYFDAPYTVYNTDGRIIGVYNAGAKADLPKGLYVISSKDVKHKILVE